MMHSNGISLEGDILDLSLAHKVTTRSGAWFKYKDAFIGQGKEKARAYLVEHPEVAQELKQKILIAGGYAIEPAQPAEEEAAASD
jgi:recombination protein RecA